MYYNVSRLIDLVFSQSRLARRGCNHTHDLGIVLRQDGLGATPCTSICTPDFNNTKCASYSHLFSRHVPLHGITSPGVLEPSSSSWPPKLLILVILLPSPRQ
jgi:hypothetical protein